MTGSRNDWEAELALSAKQLELQLAARGRSRHTQAAYVRWVRRFVRHCERRPMEITAAQVEQYFVYLTQERGLAAATRNQCAAALKFYFGTTLGRAAVSAGVVKARGPKTLPTVLSGTEVKQVLAGLKAPVHHTLALLCYGAGLRVGEACRLRVDDIDSRRMVIHVRNGKGGKDRQVALGAALLEQLRGYWRRRRPTGAYLFPGGWRRRPYLTTAAFQKALKLSVAASGIDKRVTPHTLRHSYATHMIEAGADLRTVQLLLGHGSLRSTARYVHLTHARMQKVASPLDMLGEQDGERFG